MIKTLKIYRLAGKCSGVTANTCFTLSGIQESCQKAAIKVNDSLSYSYQIAGEEN